jgi:hypothetical protein
MKRVTWSGLAVAAAFLLVPLEARGELEVAPEAKWVGRFDAERFRGTETGRLLWEKLQPEIQDKLAALKAVFQFDLKEDVRDLTAYGFGQAEDDGVLIMRGRFQPEHLATLLRGNPDYAAHAHGNHTIHSWVDEKERAAAEREDRVAKRVHGVFLDDSTAVVGAQRKSVVAALEVQTKARPGISVEDWFGELVQIRETPVLMAGARLAEIAHATPHAALLKQSKAVFLLLDEADGEVAFWAFLEAETEELVEALQKIAGGLLAIWELNTRDTNGLEHYLARTIEVKAKEKRLVIQLETPAEKLVELLWQKIKDSQR